MAVEMDVFKRSVGISKKERVRNDDIRLIGVDGNIIHELQSTTHLVWA
jgi:hypothetical protein